MLSTFRACTLLGLFLLPLLGCDSAPDLPNVEVQDLRAGDGATATAGQRLYVHYIGKLENGTVFDSSCDDLESGCEGKTPFNFVLGAREVISGWDIGIPGMKVGGIRRLVIPPGLAYGRRAVCHVNNGVVECPIPANSTLTFDVLLVDVTAP